MASVIKAIVVRVVLVFQILCNILEIEFLLLVGDGYALLVQNGGEVDRLEVLLVLVGELGFHFYKNGLVFLNQRQSHHLHSPRHTNLKQ